VTTLVLQDVPSQINFAKASVHHLVWLVLDKAPLGRYAFSHLLRGGAVR
jgi:hypothetical protein